MAKTKRYHNPPHIRTLRSSLKKTVPMKSMTYTNFILTVIAGCLALLTVQQYQFFPEVKAEQSGIHPYQSLLPLSEDGSLKVSISNLDEVDVNISRISTYDELEVKVEEFGRPLKVEME